MISKQFFTICAFAGILGLVLATGKQDYGGECSLRSSVAGIFRNDDKDESKECNNEKNLVCVGSKCACYPGYTYEKSGILSVFTGGRCSKAVNTPCAGAESECVTNSECIGDLMSVCKCKDGYYAQDGHCTNGSSKNFLSVTFIVTMLASYFLLSY